MYKIKSPVGTVSVMRCASNMVVPFVLCRRLKSPVEEVVPTPMLFAKYALPVVVAPPYMVRPEVPSPMVEDAVERRPENVERPEIVSAPAKVEVAVVEVAVRYGTVSAP